MFKLGQLPYDYAALTPHISADIMRLHHSKHHQTYVDKLNAAVDQLPDASSLDIVQLLQGLSDLPDSVRQAVRNHGGGHYNHQLFWEIMSPNGGGEPSGELGRAINSKYGSFQNFVDQFSDEATKLFGSGWVWLNRDLEIVGMPNQDNPLMYGGQAPLMGLDVWEHAYYLDYYNRRDEYIRQWWEVVDWEAVDYRLRG